MLTGTLMAKLVRNEMIVRNAGNVGGAKGFF
jgi:hypothetical protein